MTSIASLAAEFDAQPYEVAAFADLGQTAQDAELDAETESMIREAWALGDGIPSTAEINRSEDRLMDALADIVDHAGYDD